MLDLYVSIWTRVEKGEEEEVISENTCQKESGNIALKTVVVGLEHSI